MLTDIDDQDTRESYKLHTMEDHSLAGQNDGPMDNGNT